MIDDIQINQAADRYLASGGEENDAQMHAFFDIEFADIEARRRRQMVTLGKMVVRRRGLAEVWAEFEEARKSSMCDVVTAPKEY